MAEVLFMKKYRQITMDERIRMEHMISENIIQGFEELTTKTTEWLHTPQAAEFFTQRQGRINDFYRTSGINTVWNEIIEARSRSAMDISDFIYGYARKLNYDDVINFTRTEKQIMNRLADSQYDLVRNVTQQEVQQIRRSMLQDYAEGRNPRDTTLKEIQLQPINGWSPEQRAVVIARTETATNINTATLQQYRADGIRNVTLLCSDPCDECEALEGELVPIESAMEQPAIHPNCRCAWIPYEGETVT